MERGNLLCIFLILVGQSTFCQIEDYRFWITKMSGGNGYGKISSLNTDGSKYDDGVVFKGAEDGANIAFPLLQGSDGYLYGVAQNGGKYDWGVLFKMSTDGSSFLILHDFKRDQAANPSSGLIEGPNGKLYGTCRGSSRNSPLLFEFDLNMGVLNVIHEFSSEPNLSLISVMLASNGSIYGTCDRTNNTPGIIFKYDLAARQYQKLIDLTALRPGKLLEASDGALYATLGQTNQFSLDGATIFKINPDGSGFTTIFEFGSIGTSNPSTHLTEGPDGYLYGTAGPSVMSGLIYKVKMDGTGHSILHNFSWSSGHHPLQGLTLAPDGLLYGFTSQGGASNEGSYFRIEADGTGFEVLKDLDSDIVSISSFMLSENGIFYVTSGFGKDEGSIHMFKTDGTSSKLKQLTETIDHPYQIFHTKSNNIYGIARDGGEEQYGGVFTLRKDGSNNLAIVYENRSTDEATFSYNFAEDDDGNLYGFVGGSGNWVGKLSSDHVVSKIFEFPDNTFTWAVRGELMLASDGYLYAITAGGGAHGKGTIYRLKTDGSDAGVQHDFEDQTIARQPIQFESNGYLYGVCSGGANGKGLIYRFHTETKAFEKIFDLTTSFGTTLFGYIKLLKGSDNMIYGLATSGGTAGRGMLFKMTLEGTEFQEIKSFNTGDKEDMLPTRLLEGPDAKLYGITAGGGEHDTGVIFSLDKDGSSYRRIFELPEEPDLRFLAEVDLNLIAKIPHNITFNLLSNTAKVGDAPMPLSASSDAGLPISFESSDPSVARVEGTSLIIVGVGQATITARQIDNDFYTRSPTSEILTVNRGNQDITFNTLPTVTVGDADFELAALSTAGLPVVYSTIDDNISIQGNRVSILTSGRATIVAEQSGDVNYHAAAPVEQTFCIRPAKPIISDQRLTSTSLLLSSSNDFGNQWYFNGIAIAGATEKTYTAIKDGSYTVISRAADCLSDVSDEYLSVVTSVEAGSKNAISVYPNPVQDEFTVEVPDTNARISISIIDASGKVLLKRSDCHSKEILNLGFANRGLYFVQLMVDDTLYLEPILKR